MKFHVSIWGSHPDEDNDDCWTSDDFDSEEAAAAVYLAPQGHFPFCFKDGGCTHVMFEGPSGRLVRELPGAAKIRARREREDREYEDECRREAAMLAGMAGGCDAYNDAMGCSLEHEED